MKMLICLLVFTVIYGCTDSDELVMDELSLSEEEREDLQYLKEEEKLARDVYLYAYDRYQQNLFKNISNSEQAHMNSVTLILKKYNVEDLSMEAQGEFRNSELQKLYNELTSLSELSIQDALTVGATIEDLDINDLNRFISNTSCDDIESMYELLRCGSRNHIRAFTEVLDNYGKVYVPQFITLEEYEAIMVLPKEKCNN